MLDWYLLLALSYLAGLISAAIFIDSNNSGEEE